jgi:transcriptional regulator with XRE-family HTH domain
MIDEQAFYESVGRLIREERKGQECTQEKLAKATSLSRVSITNIESGKQRVPLHTLADIAEALKVPIEKLIPSGKVSFRTIRQKVDTKEIERLARTFFDDSETPDK